MQVRRLVNKYGLLDSDRLLGMLFLGNLLPLQVTTGGSRTILSAMVILIKQSKKWGDTPKLIAPYTESFTS